ncbi:MAG: [protein-PII] uridylyltransferase [Deltaproteobacteria bacterium]|nr:[protein-PII] uridylyltransferase [Deltaproteobacteria bacterium]
MLPPTSKADAEISAASLLKEKRKRLVSHFLKGKCPEFLVQHTKLFDDYFCERFETSSAGPKIGITRNPFTIVAIGGYGRKEQCIRSDIDVLFLFRKDISDAAEALVQEMIYPLWDIGLEVGYAVRSIEECILFARKDYETLTPIMDARFICGVSQVYMELLSAVKDRLICRKSKDLIAWLVERNQKRHDRFGDCSYLLEPNLKEGQGGLRDYHTMLWIARIQVNLKEPRDLEYEGYLSHDEYHRFVSAVSFIWQVRNHLHHLCNRKCDQLHFEYQIRLAESMKVERVHGLLPVERLLGILHGHMEFIKQQYQMFIREYAAAKRIRRIRRSRKTSRSPGVKGIKINKDTLTFTSSNKILQTPELLVEIFKESATLKAPLSAEAKRLIKEFSYLIDSDLRNIPSVVSAFEKILLMPPPTLDVMNDMLSTGFLQRFIPEVQCVVNRIQYNDYHLYPVDRHLILTVETVKSFGASSDLLCGTLYHELKEKKTLLWAALLHDIGKGRPERGHCRTGSRMAKQILAQKGLKPEEIDTVSFLVRNHLFLIETATRRDIQDEETAIACAREIKDMDRLKMLYLLSVADAMSTGPKAWNEWTAALLRDLFLKVLTTLESGELASRESAEIIERKKQELLGHEPATEIAEELESFFDVMSQRYLLYAKSQEIINHIKLYKRLGEADFVWDIATGYESDTRQVTICAKDRPGLLSRIAGVFTLSGLNILDVQVFTWKNHIALDIFKVEPPPDKAFEAEKWNRTGKMLQDALWDRLDITAAVRRRMSVYRPRRSPTLGKPHHVIIDNEASSFFTIIEVFTYDFPGLLFLITDTLFRCKLDVWVAKIGTKVDQVVDVFYVRDFDGQKVDSTEQVSSIKQAVLNALQGAS